MAVMIVNIVVNGSDALVMTKPLSPETREDEMKKLCDYIEALPDGEEMDCYAANGAGYLGPTMHVNDLKELVREFRRTSLNMMNDGMGHSIYCGCDQCQWLEKRQAYLKTSIQSGELASSVYVTAVAYQKELDQLRADILAHLRDILDTMDEGKVEVARDHLRHLVEMMEKGI